MRVCQHTARAKQRGFDPPGKARLRDVLRLITWLLFLGVLCSGHSSHATEPPIEIARRFCLMDMDGALLSPEGIKNVASFFGSPVPWRANREVVIVENYTLYGPKAVGQTTLVTIEYRVWGAIDSSLHFIREEGIVPDAPVKYRESYNFALTDQQNAMGQHGKMTLRHGDLAWRIQVIPSRAHVSVAAAMNYLTQRLADPAVGRNADVAIAALKRLSAGASAHLLGQSSPTPSAVVTQFCDLDAAGKRLTPDGRREVSRLLIPEKAGGAPPTASVVRKSVIGNAFIEDETAAGVTVEYTCLGELDLASGALDQGIVAELQEQSEFRLVRAGSLGKSLESAGAIAAIAPQGGWKIQTHTNEPHISVETAMRYITSLRDKTTSRRVSRNAEKTLLILQELNDR